MHGASDIRPSGVDTLRRLTLAACGLIAVLAGIILSRILATNGLDLLDALRLVLVVIATFWLAWGAALAMIGIFVQADVQTRWANVDSRPIRGRTVVLMAIHAEDPVATFARIAAMEADLKAAGLTAHVQIAILSDTQDPALAAREEVWFARLLSETRGEGRLFYRRRRDNNGRKAGNIADFIRRSGAAWDHALVLDADSLMTADTIGRMIRRMEDAPRLGLLQTAPVVAGARSRFGRAMQFAAGFHGASYMRGLAALQGATGPFWGHNALIRIRAFAQSCGLPELTGRPPFGGHVLSHDYVEAALLARAGWEVRLDPDLGGSFEESPETILTHARRDRRWCQGNLQYIRLLTAPGLPGWNRFVLLQGILAYVAPVLWLVFLGASLLAGALGGPAYEPVLVPLVGANPFEGSMAEWLMTEWSSPVLEPEMAATALGLALGVLGLLVLPKLLILTEAIRTGRVAGYGGAWRASAGVAAELAVSVMTAPILLMYQARSVAEVLTGRDGGWPVQARSEGTVPLALSWRASWWITVTGAGLATMAVLLVPNLLVWLSPVCVPMLFAPAVISWTSRPGGSWLFAMPAEQEPPAVVVRFSTILARWRGLPDGATPPTELEPVLNG